MPDSGKPQEMVDITARVPIALATAFEQLATDEDRSVSAELRRAMRSHLENMRALITADGEMTGAA